MKSTFLIFAALTALTTTVFAADGTIYFYRVEITNATLSNYGDASGRVANYLVEKGFSKDCVDLRELGSTSTGTGTAYVLKHGTEGIVLMSPLSEADEQNIKDRICSGTGQTGCKVSITFKKEQLSNLSIEAYPEQGWSAPQNWRISA